MWITGFAIYIFLVLHVTCAGTIYDLFYYESGLRQDEINIFAFFYLGRIDFLAYGINLLMFAPLGFFVPIIWPHTCKATYIVPMSLGLSFLIEISQLLNHSRTDIDDLILNVIGAAIGFVVVKIVFGDQLKDSYSRVRIKSEPIIYLLIMFFFRFFFFNEMGLKGIWHELISG